MNWKLTFAGALSLALTVSAAQNLTTNSTTQKGSVSGTIVKAGTSDPIRKALVSLQRTQGQGQPNSKSVVTGDDGTFSFTDIDAGQYRLSVERDGFIAQEYGQRSWSGTGTPLTVENGKKVSGLSVQLITAGTIVGTIRDDHGEALAGVQVSALTYTYQNGTRTLSTSRQAQTNDVGEYRLYWMTPGDYYISATPGFEQLRLTAGGQRGGPRGGQGPSLVASSIDSYAPTYYPGGIEPESAAPVTLAPAVEVRGIDFTLRNVPTVKVKGKVTSPEAIPVPQQQQQPGQRGGPGRGQPGQPGQPPFPGGGGVQVLLSRVGPGANVGGRGGGPGGGGRGGPGGRGGDGLVQAAPVAVKADGTFEISNVIPGTYNLTAIQRSQEKMLSGRTRVDVGNAGVEFVGVDMKYGLSVSGQIQTEGSPSAQFRMNNMRVTLTPTENLPFGNAETQVDEQGKFTLTNIGAMTYRVNVQGLGGGSYLVGGKYGNTEALNELLVVSDGGSQLVLRVGFTPGQVTGVATDKSGQAFRAATMALVPSARNRMDLYRTTTSDQEGKFSFTNVAPGDYKVLAWEDVPRGAYTDAAFLKNYEDRGRAITLDKGENETVQVAVIASGTP